MIEGGKDGEGAWVMESLAREEKSEEVEKLEEERRRRERTAGRSGGGEKKRQRNKKRCRGIRGRSRGDVGMEKRLASKVGH